MARTELGEKRSKGSWQFGLIRVDQWWFALKNGIYFLIGDIVFNISCVNDVFYVVISFWREYIVDEEIADVVIVRRLKSCLHLTRTGRSFDDAV